MASKTAPPPPSLHTAELLMRELIEASRKFEKLFEKLARTDPATEKGFELFGDLWAQAELIRSKAEHSKEELDHIMDAFPD
jgi:hypothetical protein